jgi:hypothetical protein
MFNIKKEVTPKELNICSVNEQQLGTYNGQMDKI